MEHITAFTHIDFTAFFLTAFAMLLGIKAILSALEWAAGKLGLEIKWLRKRKEERRLLLQTSQELSSLQARQEADRKRSDKRDEEIRTDIKKLTDIFVDKQIDDMRWEINNFATTVTEGRPCNKDSFTHCIHTYEKYEKILKDNGLENGEVEISMDLIQEAYRQKRKEGF